MPVLFIKLKKKTFLPLDPDFQYGSGSTKSLNPDPIRIHNPGLKVERKVLSVMRKLFFYRQEGQAAEEKKSKN
jgi:hypothetical protein